MMPISLAKSGSRGTRADQGVRPTICAEWSPRSKVSGIGRKRLPHLGVRIAYLDLTHAAVAVGGTLVSFPALIWLGLSSVTANATSTVAIWPGTLGSAWGYRRELRDAEPRFRILIVPSLVGGIAGALLLRWTPPAFFDKLVPYLILFATLLFMAQEPVQRKLKTAEGRQATKGDGLSHPAHESTRWIVGALLFQLAVGIYGGYFLSLIHISE